MTLLTNTPTNTLLFTKNGKLVVLDDITGNGIKLPNKDQVMDYLFNAEFFKDASLGFSVTDKLTGQPINAIDDLYSDGKYYWTDVFAMYVLLHDIDVPQEFLDHIAGQNITVSNLQFNWRTYNQDEFIKEESIKFPKGISYREKLAIIDQCKSREELKQRIAELQQSCTEH